MVVWPTELGFAVGRAKEDGPREAWDSAMVKSCLSF